MGERTHNPSQSPRFIALYGATQSHNPWLKDRRVVASVLPHPPRMGPWVYKLYPGMEFTQAPFHVEVHVEYARVEIRHLHTGGQILPVGYSWAVSTQFIVGVYRTERDAHHMLRSIHNRHLFPGYR